MELNCGFPLLLVGHTIVQVPLEPLGDVSDLEGVAFNVSDNEWCLI
jgi:hypothetical protein